MMKLKQLHLNDYHSKQSKAAEKVVDYSLQHPLSHKECVAQIRRISKQSQSALKKNRTLIIS